MSRYSKCDFKSVRWDQTEQCVYIIHDNCTNDSLEPGTYDLSLFVPFTEELREIMSMAYPNFSLDIFMELYLKWSIEAEDYLEDSWYVIDLDRLEIR